MAKFDAQNAAQGVHMQLSSLWGFDTEDVGNSSTNYSWLTSAGHDVQARGTGFAFSGGQPTNGYVHSLEFDFNNDNFTSPDVVVSNVGRYLTNITNAPQGQFFNDILSGDDEIIGSDFNDYLYGFDGDDVMNGGVGTNNMYGGTGNDVITEGGNDRIYAGDDNDRVMVTSDVVGDGDIFNGGAGNDWLDFSNVVNEDGVVHLGIGKYFKGQDGSVFDSLSGFENVEGGSGRDVIYASSTSDVANILNGNGGDDVISAYGGDDTINGGAGIDQIRVGSGNDTIIVDAEDGSMIEDLMDGGSGHDRIVLKGRDTDNVNLFDMNNDRASIYHINEIEFRADGNVDKTLALQAWNIGGNKLSDTVRIDGHNGSQHATEKIEIHMADDDHVDLSGWTFQDWGDQSELISIFGDGDAETMIGSTEEDVILGHGGGDHIDGSEGSDAVFAGSGDDTVKIAERNTGDLDHVDGGSGTDTIDFSGMATAAWADLDYTGSTGHEAWTRGGTDVNSGAWQAIADLDKIENITASQFSDIFYGDTNDNMFTYVGDGVSSGGFDQYKGEGGEDTADFSETSSAVWVDLSYSGSTGIEAWTRGGADVNSGTWTAIADLSGINNIIGTKNSDKLYGDAGNNTFGYVGSEGGGGFDQFDGDAGTDTADFSSADTAVWVDLDYTGSTGYEAWTRGGADVDSGTWKAIADLTSIENVTGSNYSDKLTGDAGNNTFGYVGDGFDSGGFDQFHGEGGSDTADFSKAGSAVWVDLDYTGSTDFEAWTRGGTDVNSGTWTAIADMTGIENLTGSAYDDHLRGDTGSNVFTGGAGADTFVFEDNFGNDTVTDFQNGTDLLNFTLHAGVDSFADVSVSVVGDDTVVTASDGSVTLLGVTTAIDADDFVF